MATTKRKPVGTSQPANRRQAPTTGYFSQAPAPAQAQAQAAPIGGATARPAEGMTGAPVTTPNVTPGLPALGADASAPGAGLSTTYNGEATPGDLQGAASAMGTASSIATPAGIAARDAGLFGMGQTAGLMGKGLGIASDMMAENYGKAMTGVASLAGGPVGLAAGLGRMGYDAYQGGWGEGSVPTGMAGDLGARAATAMDEGLAREGVSNTGDTNVYFDGTAYTEAAPQWGGTPTAATTLGGDLGLAGLNSGYDSSGDTSPTGYGPGDMGPPSSAAGDTYGGGNSDSGGSNSSGGPGDGTSADYANGGMVGHNQPVGLSMSGYADGGEVGGGPLLAMGFAQGGRVAGMGNPGGDMSPEMIEMKVNQMARSPQFQQGVMQAVQPLMQSGELTPQEVTVMGQIAMASMQNPKLYPQLRQFVAQQGMSPLPPSYDPTTIMKILAVTRALEQSGGGMAQPGQGQPTPAGQVPPTSQAQMVNPTGAPDGGMLQGPGTGRSDSIGTQNMSNGGPVKVSNGEYVIPEHVVRAKGRDFFDALLRRYSEVPKAEA